MPANPWDLRADVRPLEVAATRWDEVGELMARRGDEIVDAAQRATEGWDAAAAESYAEHRRQVLAHLDRFTTLAAQLSGSLRAISAIITASQEELGRAWTGVALVPHDLVGESRSLVFRPDAEEDRSKVDVGRAETEEIRRRLALALDQESARIRTARADLVVVRTELTTLGGGTFGEGATVPGLGPGILPGIGPSVLRGIGPGGAASGVGTVMSGGSPGSSAATSVAGSAQSGIAASALPPVAPVSVSMSDLDGLPARALAPFIATAAAGLAGGRKGARHTTSSATPPVGGMGAGAMGARAGSMSRGAPGGRTGTRRSSSQRLEGQDADATTSASRAERAEKEAKRAALEERRAERAARKAEREADRSRRTDPSGRSARKTEDAGDEKDTPAIVVVDVARGEELPSDAIPTGDAGRDHVPDADGEVGAGDARDVGRS